ncbi:MAG TPA: transglycosylase SLT domain-containing protein [Terracidiphilus sp.]|jgi:membrane-bound lytic murein transglycosylase D|nr:transglycosylase SLT domain-containing protein [Terracidiphilus sp.]
MSLVSYRWVLLAAPALLLAGCTPTDSATSSQNPAPQATAPAIPAVAAAQAAPAALAPPSKTPQQQRVDVLVGQVEKAYANGQTDYRKGDLLGAKAEFDRAVDLMLTSGIDIKSDPQLQDEFDHIVDGVNALEMDALKVGNGFAPKEEPTPADVASDVTFAVDPNIVAKARSELATTKSDLPLVVNDYVAAFINFFANTQKGHNTLLHSFQRAGRYKTMIQRVLAEEGVPQDLIYLAVAESGFQPRAVNARSRAGGMWQFMPGDYYGLHRDAWVDERFDPEKSTRAYGRYMKFLYNQLGDWYLAMAAYDHGAGNIQHAVQRTGYADFWELYKRHELPGETQNYVPEILAAIIIANNPTQYGFDEVTLDPPVITDTVSINYAVDLRLVSDLVDAPVDELIALNPSLLRLATPSDAQFDLHLPAGTALTFQRLIEEIPETKRNSWRYHPVVADDTLVSVARTYHVTEAELAAANQLHEGDNLQGVEALVVPVPPAATPSRGMFYTTRRGDTLVSIADRFGVSLTQLRRWNNLAGTKVPPGHKLRVAEPAHVVRAGATHHHGSAAATSNGDAAPAASHKSGSHPASHKSSSTASTAKSTPHATASNKTGKRKKSSTHAVAQK